LGTSTRYTKIAFPHTLYMAICLICFAEPIQRAPRTLSENVMFITLVIQENKEERQASPSKHTEEPTPVENSGEQKEEPAEQPAEQEE